MQFPEFPNPLEPEGTSGKSCMPLCIGLGNRSPGDSQLQGLVGLRLASQQSVKQANILSHVHPGVAFPHTAGTRGMADAQGHFQYMLPSPTTG